jgi:large subunit ribosomal protein L26e
MSTHLSKDLRSKYNVRSIPIRKGDEVAIMRGFYKGKSGKVTTVYRKRWCVYIEKLTKDKHNGK